MPEKYTIWFTISDSEIDTTTAYCISTSFGHGSNLAWQYHVFSLEDLQTYFETPNGTFRTKIRADNDTDNSFSTLTTEMTIAIPDQLPFINLGNWSAPTNTCTDTSTTTTTTSTTIPAAAPNAPTNTSVNYQGEDVFFNWEYSPGETDLVEFHINYSYDNQTWTRVVISDVDATSYTLDKSLIQTGTFYWEIASCGDVSAGESCSNGDSNNFETTEYVAPTTTLAPAPQPAPEPEPEPEPAPPPITEVVVIGGEEVEYTEAQVLDGNIDRDLQRDKNQDLYGCSLTDAQLARGDDCDGEVIVEIITVDEFDEMDDDDWDNDDFIDDEYVLTDEEIEELERQAQKDAERMQRELDELEKEIEKQVIDELGDDFFDGPVDDLSDEELLELEELVDSIIFLQENVDFDDFVVIDDEPDFLNEIEFDDEIIIVIPEDDKKEDVAPIIEVFDEEEDLVPIQEPIKEVEEKIKESKPELSEAEVIEVEEAIVELVEVIESNDEVIPEVPDEIIEDLTEEQVDAVVDTYVETLELEAKVEIIEDVVDVGLEDLSDEQVTVVAAVVESAIDDVEELDEEQVETVAEVLGLDDSDDVAVLAVNVQEDEAVAAAVDSYVERAASEENADVEDYNVADAVVEYQTEEFLENPIVILQVDFQEITFAALDTGMTAQQKEKSQEVVVPVIIASQIVAASVVPYRRIK